VLADLACSIADGGEVISDFRGVLRGTDDGPGWPGSQNDMTLRSSELALSGGGDHSTFSVVSDTNCCPDLDGRVQAALSQPCQTP
jgi:hypothetical protein